MKLKHSEGYNNGKKFLCFMYEDSADWQGFARFFKDVSGFKRLTTYFVNDKPVTLEIADDRTIINYHI